MHVFFFLMHSCALTHIFYRLHAFIFIFAIFFQLETELSVMKGSMELLGILDIFTAVSSNERNNYTSQTSRDSTVFNNSNVGVR